jgi:hypothetical protein
MPRMVNLSLSFCLRKQEKTEDRLLLIFSIFTHKVGEREVTNH